MDEQIWWQSREANPEKFALAVKVLEEIRAGKQVQEAVRRYPLPEGEGYLGKHHLVSAYYQLVNRGEMTADPHLLARIRMKPIRSLSGVSVVTVLTKPYPCPGKCIFCPSDVRMPKSYLPDEPGAMRGLQHQFDPYNQVRSRIEALEAVGHPTDKIELLILGGTFSAYRRDYQEWFVQRCFDAMNQDDSTTLAEAQYKNETAASRNVGLTIETRPDHIDHQELVWLRYLGVTKVQLGAQSFDNRILEMNQRGHSAEITQRAVASLRAAGFKIVLHWMPNLYGATLESDHQDFLRLWDGYCPDELKIYPNQLLESTDLYTLWKQELYQPYTTGELVDLLADLKPSVPRYCRVNRVIRDIPSTHVVEGNRRTSLRQDIQVELQRRGTQCQCIRCREVRRTKVGSEELQLDDLIYHVGTTEEHFLSFVTPEDRLAGFLRLSLPDKEAKTDTPSVMGLYDLEQAAIIREVHVYGQSLEVGARQPGFAQHMGLGTQLIRQAEMIAADKGYRRLAVIAAVGTRPYYIQRGFQRGELYLVKELPVV